MMRFSAVCFRMATRRATPSWHCAALSTSAMRVNEQGTIFTAIDQLHQIVEDYRQKTFPQTMPTDFVDQVLFAADENEDGRISVGEMMVMLRNIYSHQPITHEEVRFIMETRLELAPEEDSVPMEKVKHLLLDIDH